ncbi:MAG: hypothetical protein KGK11_01955 [Sphingomonadales bacterium]|nr:hypothetical protein [Sphingomonadales bacterium]
MGLLDSLLGQAGQNVDVAAIAGRLGIDPAVAAQAVAALGAAHGQPGDTVDTAAAQTGIDSDTLSQVCNELGGHAGLSQLSDAMQNHPEAASLVSAFQGGDSGGLLGMAESFFSRN